LYFPVPQRHEGEGLNPVGLKLQADNEGVDVVFLSKKLTFLKPKEKASEELAVLKSEVIFSVRLLDECGTCPFTAIEGKSPMLGSPQ